MRVPVRLIVTVLTLSGMVFFLVVISETWTRKIPTSSQDIDASARPVDKLVKDQPNTSPAKQHHHLISPLWWRNHIQTSCNKLGFYTNYNSIDPEKLKNTKILVDDANKLLYCQIPKVASTTWRRILLVLSGKMDLQNPMSISANDVHHKYDEHLTYLNDLPHEGIVHRLNTYFKFVFVREPFERLLSAFRNKFVTKTNSSMYFKRVFGRKIIDKYRSNPPPNNGGSGLKFSEFVEYLIDPDKKIVMNEHWERFHKLCHPCLITYDFIGKLQTIEEDSQYILDRNSLSNKVKVPSRSDSRYAHHKTNSYMAEYYSQIPRDSLVKLYKMYSADFVIFNFTVPQVLQLMMK